MSNDEIYEEYLKLNSAHSIACDLYHHAKEENRDAVWEIVRSVRNSIRELRSLAPLPRERVYVDGTIYDKLILKLSDGRVFAWVDINLWPLKFRDVGTWQLDPDSD